MSRTNKQFTENELTRINDADDLKISPFREDGITYGTPTWIWEVVVKDGLYVRAYNGTSSRWYRSALKQKTGRIHAAGLLIEVCFEPVSDPVVNQLIGQAYRKKYSKSPYMVHMISSTAAEATIMISPA